MNIIFKREITDSIPKQAWGLSKKNSNMNILREYNTYKFSMEEIL